MTLRLPLGVRNVIATIFLVAAGAMLLISSLNSNPPPGAPLRAPIASISPTEVAER